MDHYVTGSTIKALREKYNEGFRILYTNGFMTSSVRI